MEEEISNGEYSNLHLHALLDLDEQTATLVLGTTLLIQTSAILGVQKTLTHVERLEK